MNLVFVGAHPDDGDVHAGGVLAKAARDGANVTLISLTSGNAGHQSETPERLASRRAEEARLAGASIGAEYIVLDHPDGRLEPTVAVREELIGLLRQLAPDLLLTLRPWDYHADHRACGQLVMDASFLLGVPLIRPNVPPLREMPVIAYVFDRFRVPAPFRPDIAVAIDDAVEAKLAMVGCHVSQFYEWLPWVEGCDEPVPEDPEARPAWLARYCEGFLRGPASVCREALIARYGLARAGEIHYAEAFEVCEYGRQPSARELDALFPR